MIMRHGDSQNAHAVLSCARRAQRTTAQHFELGRALRPLRDEGVLLLASGGATHNLRLYMVAAGRAVATPEGVDAFNAWVADAVEARRFDDLVRYRELAPHAAHNHPTEEHFLPLFVALGAAFDDERGARIHASYDLGLLSLDAYAFGFDRAAAASTRTKAAVTDR
jgi:4,5-DOPA dioxygenase extradiol